MLVDYKIGLVKATNRLFPKASQMQYSSLPVVFVDLCQPIGNRISVCHEFPAPAYEQKSFEIVSHPIGNQHKITGTVNNVAEKSKCLPN